MEKAYKSRKEKYYLYYRDKCCDKRTTPVKTLIFPVKEVCMLFLC